TVEVKASRKKKAGSRRGRGTTAPSAENTLWVVILAGGAGSRMRSTLPKVLHRVAGRSLIESVLDASEAVSAERIVAVLGASPRQVEPVVAGRAAVVLQAEPRGTADAIRLALSGLPSREGSVLVLSGAAPLVLADTLRSLVERQQREQLDAA